MRSSGVERSIDMGESRRPNAKKDISAAALRILDQNCVSPKVYELVRKASDGRQLEMATIMDLCSNFSLTMASTLLAITLRSEFKPGKLHEVFGVSRKELAKMRQEFRPLVTRLKASVESYKEVCLQLAVAAAYARRLVTTEPVVQFLSSKHPEELEVLRKISSELYKLDIGFPSRDRRRRQRMSLSCR